MSDVLEIPCGGCGRALRVAPEHAGKMARCPVCGHITAVPASMGPSIPSSPSPPSEQRESTGSLVLPTDTGLPMSSPALGDGMSLGASLSLGEGLSNPTLGVPQTTQPISIHGIAALWYMKTPEEQTFGPASFQDLERWVQEGRITADCQLCQGAAGNWQPADWLFPSLKSQPTFSPLLTPPPTAPRHTPPPYAPSHYPQAGNHPPALPPSFAPGRYTAPHRGPLILILGLMGLFIQCPIFPFMSWVMGSNDLREMQAGRMDPSGRDLTRAGMVIGMVLSILWIVVFLFFFVVMLVGIAG